MNSLLNNSNNINLYPLSIANRGISFTANLPYKNKNAINVNKAFNQVLIEFTLNEQEDISAFFKKSRIDEFACVVSCYMVSIAKYLNQSQLLIETSNHVLHIDLDKNSNILSVINYIQMQLLETEKSRSASDDKCNLAGFNREIDALAENNYDLLLCYLKNQSLCLKYNENLKTDFIQHITTSIRHLVSRVVAGANLDLSSYHLLNSKLFQTLVYDWNHINVNAIANTTIHELFEEQVAKTPNNIALVYGDIKLNYLELNNRANQLANYLKTNYLIEVDDLILLYFDRSELLIIAILAILKSGGAYVPLDPSYPEARLNYILNDVKANVLLSHQLNESKITKVIQVYNQHTNNPIINLDIIDSNEFKLKVERYSKENLSLDVSHTDLSYIIYTSGTTGNPKGVMIEHGNVINFISNFLLTTESALNSVLISSYVFDVSIYCIWSNLLCGNKLFILPDATLKDIDDFKLFLIANNIQKLYLPAALLKIHYKSLSESNCTHLLTGVESLVYKYTNLLIDRNIQIINAYGPTETTVCSHSYAVGVDDDDKVIPIGKPLKNYTSYVLDNQLNPLPIGAIGELYIGGLSVARGYLNLSELSKARFIDNPFQTQAQIQLKLNNRLYKTGDLVRYLEDGNLEYIGRSDTQIKINGFRIELEEIESKLNLCLGISQSLVVVTEDELNNKYLTAYYLSAEKIEEDKIILQLAEHLPVYMIPTYFIRLEEFPLSVNCKIDRKSLPKPILIATTKRYSLPKNQLQEQVLTIFNEILQTNIKVSDNFFKFGVNSIIAIQVVSKINKILSKHKVSVVDIFRYPSIESLVASLSNIEKSNFLSNVKTVDASQKIAIIGSSGAFGGVKNVAELWALLSNQDDALRSYSREECIALGINSDLINNPNFVPVDGQLADYKMFDAMFWGLSPNEAKTLDPQIRKFIEHCWYVLEQSGYINCRKSEVIGVFAGSGYNDFFHKYVLNNPIKEQIDIWGALASNLKDALTTKTANLLGLTGPAYSINTACSTGLVSVINACDQLRLGSCNLALAGGVYISLADNLGYIYQENLILSKDGKCAPFDQNASGTVLTSGVGVVLLKRLTDAIRDDDHIIGVIQGYATNNDGDRKSSYTAPSVTGQAECIIAAQKMAGMAHIDYIECHGTATIIGDPMEITALTDAFNFMQPKNKTILGSLKANIGHTDASAGVASLIKVTEMLKHELIPGQINFNCLNPAIDLGAYFKINVTPEPWLAGDRIRVAGISSFGVGGTNAHVIVSDYRPLNKVDEAVNIERNSSYIIPLSAKSRLSLKQYKIRLANYLESADNLTLKDLAYTLVHHREHFNIRDALVVNDIPMLIEELTRNDFKETSSTDNKIIFIFPGQGAQYFQMGLGLYQNDLEYANIIDMLIDEANNVLNYDIKSLLFVENTDKINDTQYAQICLFIIEYGLAFYLISYLKITPDALIGHSLGELVAATIAEIFSLTDAVKLIIARGNYMQAMKKGKMLAVNAPLNEIESIVDKYAVEIAVQNSNEDIVISGSERDIDAIHQILTLQQIPNVMLHTSHAYHSSMMDLASEHFEVYLQQIKFNKSTRYTIFSNLTGDIAGDELLAPNYWAAQLKNQVKFSECIKNSLECYNNNVTFIEIGPGKNLSYFIDKYKKQITSNGITHNGINTIQILPSYKQSMESFPLSKKHIQAILWSHGVGLDLKDQDYAAAKLITNLPHYQFASQEYWINESSAGAKLEKNSYLLSQSKWLNTLKWSFEGDLDNFKQDTHSDQPSLVFLAADNFDYSKSLKFSKDTIYVKLDLSNDRYLHLDNIITINPVNEEHFSLLSNHTRQRGIKVILHMASINSSISTEDGLSLSVYNLYLIKKYILQENLISDLYIITMGLFKLDLNDRIIPANGALAGAFRNIQNEHLEISSWLIDVGVELNQAVLTYVMNRFKTRPILNQQLIYAIRMNKLWQQNLHPIQAINQNSIDNFEPKIKDGDCILISGGLGGISLSIALKISEKHQNIRFILISRQNLEGKPTSSSYIRLKLEILASIKKNGAIVDIISCNLSDVVAVERLGLSQYHVNVIIHTAGVIPSTGTENHIENIKQAFAAKVYGIENLLAGVNLTKVRLIALTSSLASIMGDVNRFDYCASNSYLDYLSKDTNRFSRLQIISINWPGWSNIGMLVEHDFSRSLTFGKNLNQLEAMSRANLVDAAEGAQIFYDILQYYNNFSQIIVSKVNLDDLQKEFHYNSRISHDVGVKIKLVESQYTILELEISQYFADILGIEELSLHDDIFNLGCNSLLAIRFLAKINNKFTALKLSLTDLMHCKTIRNVVGKINSLNTSTDHQILKTLSYNPAIYQEVFFIHPGYAGCEVYMEIVQYLKSQYNCYGLDNYNIQQDSEISNLYELASYFLQLIQPKLSKTDKTILVGWSFGGRVALEMAYLLEQLGYSNIELHLFDAIICNDDLKLMLKSEKTEEVLPDFITEQNLAQEYLVKVKKAALAENLMIVSDLPGVLEFSKCILYKASQVMNANKPNFTNYVFKLYDNNLSKYVKNLTVFNLEANHWNILQKYEKFIQVLGRS